MKTLIKGIFQFIVTIFILSIVVFTVMIIFGYGINIKLKNNKEYYSHNPYDHLHNINI